MTHKNWILAAVCIACATTSLAQTCDPEQAKVRGSITHNSTLPYWSGPSVVAIRSDGQGWPFSPGWGEGSISLGLGEWTIHASLTYFFGIKVGTATCFVDGEGCLKCEGSYNGILYGASGGAEGQVVVEPFGAPFPGPSTPAIQVFKPTEGGPACTPGGGSGQSGVPGGFKWPKSNVEPAFQTNNWGLGVDDPGVDGGAPGTAVWAFHGGDCEEVIFGIVKSDVMTDVGTLHLRSGYMEEDPPECRTCPNVGKPLNVITGNVWLGQTDGSVPSLAGGSLTLTRSYNSLNAYRNRGGLFGRGWHTPFDRKIDEPEAGVVRVRLADGSPVYLKDPDGDGTYEAAVPRTERTRVVKSAAGYVREFPAGATETYDAQGRLTAMTDDGGLSVTVERDAQGKLLAVREPGGRFLSFVYSGTQVVQLVGPGGTLASYEYGTGGLTSVRYADGEGYSFTYGSNSVLLAVRDETGRLLESHTYGANGQGLTSELEDSREKYTMARPAAGRQATITDSLGRATTYEWAYFKGMRKMVSVTGPCPGCGGSTGSLTQRWEYDEDGREMAYEDGTGARTEYEYDALGNRVKETDALDRETTYVYDAQRRVVSTTSPGGATTAMTYGPHGPLTTTDGLTRTTTMTYNAQGRVATVTDSRGKTTTFGYATNGDLATVTDSLGHTTTFGYDAMGRRTTVTDARGKTSTTVYDLMGRVVRSVSPDGTSTDFTYDASGHRTAVKDPMGKVTRYAYDAYGRLENVLDPMGGQTRYGYDLMGNLTSLTDAKGQTTSFEYDAFDRAVKTTYPGGAFESFTYDAAGRLATKTDRKGIVTTYAYDILGRLTGKSYSDGTTPPVTYTYDVAGRMATAANGTDTLTWAYDLAGQLVSEESAKNNSLVSYTYDAAGNRLTLSLDGQLFTSYAYDDASRLTSITRGSDVYGFAYDELNRRTSLTYPNGVVTTYAYDDLSRVLRIKADHAPTGNPITDFQYTYDAAGNRTRKAQLDYTEDYAYDALYRLTGAERTAGLQTGTLTGRWRWTYDAVGNRILNQHDDTVTTSAYNERNQLLSAVVGGNLKVRGFLDEPGTAKVNGMAARMLAENWFEAEILATPGTNSFSVEATDASGNVTTKEYTVEVGGDTATYQYDANGNTVQKLQGAGTWTYEWNAENQLVKLDRNGVQVAANAYDPLGRRVEKAADDTLMTFAYDGNRALRHAAGSSTTTFTHGDGTDEPFASEGASSVLGYLHADALGTILATTSSQGSILTSMRNDAWGQPQSGTSGPYSYAGREWDNEIALYFNRARFLDPKSGRFVSEDPIRFQGGIDFYQYANGNPVLYRDPSGLRIMVCNRYGFFTWTNLNHSYFWDTRRGSWGAGPQIHRNCGRGSQSGFETGPGTPGTVCYDVPGSDGREDELLDCCEKTKQGVGMFLLGWPEAPFTSMGTGLQNQSLNDCHTSLYRCLFKAGLPSPPHPRIGCRDCGGRYEYPHEYGGGWTWGQ